MTRQILCLDIIMSQLIIGNQLLNSQNRQHKYNAFIIELNIDLVYQGQEFFESHYQILDMIKQKEQVLKELKLFWKKTQTNVNQQIAQKLLDEVT
ncbi:unnamed protein product [Paramecium octaurelia]|uniref:Uncharacterized protein n=1 Tax=Paramecium octaurelia TaxID=43137 RepID=A0A8S1RYZ9_PAROT|nr:unnamed protein product [Paramecium octaurelia]